MFGRDLTKDDLRVGGTSGVALNMRAESCSFKKQDDCE